MSVDTRLGLSSPVRVPVMATTTDAPGVMSPVTVIDAELRRIDVARRSKARRTQRERLDRLIDYVWFSGPETA